MVVSFGFYRSKLKRRHCRDPTAVYNIKRICTRGIVVVLRRRPNIAAVQYRNPSRRAHTYDL